MGFIFIWSPALCGASDVVPADGDAIVTSSISEPVNLIPFFASDSASADISSLIFNGLVKYDKDLSLVGDLAERWEVKNGGLKIIFYLKNNVLWQDGKPFTAEDVVFTFQKLTDPNVPTPYGGDFEKIKNIEMLGPYAVEVNYKEPFSPGLSSWGMGIVPKHILEKQDLLKTDFSRHPIGTGPYILKKWKTGEKLELTANPGYFEGRPHIDRYIYRIIPDQSTAFLELQTDNLDLGVLTPLQYQKQTESRFFHEKFSKFRMPSSNYVYLGYNLENPLFMDKKVRKALGLAIQKNEIVEVALSGLGRVATGPFLPGTWAYNEKVKESAFDPEKAKRMLGEAGWADTDGDHVLDKEGKKFSFTVLTNQGNDQRRMACEMIQKRLKDIGVDMKIQTVEWGTFLKEFIDKKRFEAVVLAWQLPRDPDCFDIFHSSKTSPGNFNFVSFRSETLDKLLEKGRQVFDEEKRAPVYRRIHEILSDEEPYTFLYVPDALPIVHKRFLGIKLAPAGIGYNFIHWHVPAERQKYKRA